MTIFVVSTVALGYCCYMDHFAHGEIPEATWGFFVLMAFSLSVASGALGLVTVCFSNYVIDVFDKMSKYSSKQAIKNFEEQYFFTTIFKCIGSGFALYYTNDNASLVLVFIICRAVEIMFCINLAEWVY